MLSRRITDTMAEAAEETPTKKSVRFAEEDEEHPISPRAAPKPDADLLQGILKNAGLEGIVDAAAMDVGEDESDSSLPKGKVCAHAMAEHRQALRTYVFSPCAQQCALND